MEWLVRKVVCILVLSFFHRADCSFEDWRGGYQELGKNCEEREDQELIQRKTNKCTKNQEQTLEMTSSARKRQTDEQTVAMAHLILLASRFEEKCFHWHCGVVGENVHIKMDICVMVLPSFFEFVHYEVYVLGINIEYV